MEVVEHKNKKRILNKNYAHKPYGYYTTKEFILITSMLPCILKTFFLNGLLQW